MLDAAIEDNEILRSQKTHPPIEHHGDEGMLRRLRNAFGIMRGSVIEVDALGYIQHMSGPAIELLGVHLAEAHGKPIHSILKIFDATKDHPNEYPLSTLVPELISGASTMPRIEQVILQTRKNKTQDATLMLQATLLPDGKPIGATVNINVGTDAGELISSHASGAEPHASYKDSLTGLLTRDIFERRCDEMLALAKSSKLKHSILFYTLDQASHLSNAFSHTVLDEALWNIGRITRESVGLRGESFYLGHDVFSVLLAESNTHEATELADRLRTQVSNSHRGSGNTGLVSVSIAISEIKSDTGARHELIGLLERELATLVASGGNKVSVVAESESHAVQRRNDTQWVEWILPKLKSDQMRLVAQAAISTRKTLGPSKLLELFIRVEEDDGHWLAPAAYIPALRRQGQIQKLDLWVVESALRILSTKPKEMADYAYICVNLDSTSMSDESFCNSVFHALKSNPTISDRLCFEIAESQAQSSLTDVSYFCEKVAELGAATTLDQCRTADSISLLRRLPCKFVKFHDALVRNIQADAVDKATLIWMLQAARMLNRKTVVTNVENDDLRIELQELGADYLQGSRISQIAPLLL